MFEERTCLVVFLQRMQLDIILTSLQDHTHVASLLGYSSPTDGPKVVCSSSAFTAPTDPAYSATGGHPDTHLAEILMKTLLRNLGFYTVGAGGFLHLFNCVLQKRFLQLRYEFFRVDCGRRWAGRKSICGAPASPPLPGFCQSWRQNDSSIILHHHLLSFFLAEPQLVPVPASLEKTFLLIMTHTDWLSCWFLAALLLHFWTMNPDWTVSLSAPGSMDPQYYLQLCLDFKTTSVEERATDNDVQMNGDSPTHPVMLLCTTRRALGWIIHQ